MGADRILTHEQLGALQALLEEVVPEYYQQPAWYVLKVGDTFRLDPIRSADLDVSDGVIVVDVHTVLDDYEDWSQPMYVVFQVGTLFFRVTGKNKSHIGEEWDYATFSQVEGFIESRKAWRRAD